MQAGPQTTDVDLTSQRDDQGKAAKPPLEGVTIVELGHSVAAPYAGLILADLGARVIKVENPKAVSYTHLTLPTTPYV